MVNSKMSLHEKGHPVAFHGGRNGSKSRVLLFWTSVLDWGGGGAQRHFPGGEDLFSSPRFEPRIVQAIARHYTDYDIPATYTSKVPQKW